MSETRPCSTMDCQTWSKCGNQAKPLKYPKKVVFHTNLEQLFKGTATNLYTQPMTQQRLTTDDMCIQKCQVAATSTIQAKRSSSESNGDV